MAKRLLVVILLVCCAGVGFADAQGSQRAFRKEIVAVLDLSATGADPTIAVAASIRLREELLASGFFSLVDRQRLKQVLDEQALAQVSCVGRDCTLQVGRITGARILMTGDLVRLSEDTWQISALMTDVETAEVLRARSVYFEGGPGALVDDGIRQLVGRLIPEGDPGDYGGVVDFLMKASADLLQGAAAEVLGVETDGETGNLRMKRDNQVRVWVAPLNLFRYAIQDQNRNTLETLIGRGVSLGVEREVEKAWALGASMHLGVLEKRRTPTGAKQLTLGYYTGWSLYALDAVPNGRPWFYYGSGLFGFILNYADGGQNLMAEELGALLSARLVYPFESGAVLGLGADSNYQLTFRSKGTRIDAYREIGTDVSPHAWGLVTYLLIGYTF